MSAHEPSIEESTKVALAQLREIGEFLKTASPKDRATIAAGLERMIRIADEALEAGTAVSATSTK